MSETACEYAFDHEAGETCQHCNLKVDDYGNTEADFLNCCFPCCGCDGERLCMAPSGSSGVAKDMNIEGMYDRTDKAATEAKLKLISFVNEGGK